MGERLFELRSGIPLYLVKDRNLSLMWHPPSPLKDYVIDMCVIYINRPFNNIDNLETRLGGYILAIEKTAGGPVIQS